MMSRHDTEYSFSELTNLVRIINDTTGHVFYARTHDHSRMDIATGSTVVSTTFDVSAAAEIGSSRIVVVSNGIPSKAERVTVEWVATGRPKIEQVLLHLKSFRVFLRREQKFGLGKRRDDGMVCAWR